MNIIDEIEQLIVNNKIEQAFELIVENENTLLNNSKYWNLRGMLCYKIQECDLAINCYKKSIDIDPEFLDSYFNLIYIYILTDQKMKAALYCGLALKYSDDIKFKDELISIFEDDLLSAEYINIIKKVKSDDSINHKNLSFVKYLAIMFDEIDEEYINTIYKNNIDKSWAFLKNDIVLTNNKIIKLEDFIKLKENINFNVIIKYDIDYIKATRNIASKGIKKCFIMVENNKVWDLIEINSKDMESLKNEDYKRTITLNKFNAADSNVYALIKYMPEKYKEKYKLNIINGRDVLNLENIIKVPLISSVTISGFGTFTNYPKLTYNIEVGHGPMSFKASGNMEKTYKNFAFTPSEFKNIDKMCATSTMDTILLASFVNLSEDKFLISGMPRTDILLNSNGKENLEKILNTNFNNKKIIFNMPTFHKHENSGKEDGNSNLNSFMKVHDFNYKEFDEFLGKNEIICIMKAHHAEEKLLKSKEFKAKNIYFIFNEDLERECLDLYEILNAADLLITDYSSIYSDFLFMNKPTVFVNTDIDEYRKKRGLALEPYEFWTAGPKVQEQEELQNEILKSLNNRNYYKQKREELRTVYYTNFDDKSSERVWNYIDEIL